MPALTSPVWLGPLAALLGSAAWYNIIRLGRARRTVRAWLASRDLILVKARLCWLPVGPFGTAIARHLPVYRVLARDRAGVLRRGWVRCTPFSDEAEGAWEQTAP
jgi:membrane protein DedA with SNARE-associated domain